MIFPKELFGVDIPVGKKKPQNKQKTENPNKTWIYNFFYLGKVIGELSLNKATQPAFSVHLWTEGFNRHEGW